jgi:hypothetical protein
MPDFTQQILRDTHKDSYQNIFQVLDMYFFGTCSNPKFIMQLIIKFHL